MAKRRTTSDRGEQIAHRAQNPTSRHMTDIRGATGCYYCWLGQYDKCRESCHLVPNRHVPDPAVAAAEASYAADPRNWNAFTTAAPRSTLNAAQGKTIFDLTPAASRNYSPSRTQSPSASSSSYRAQHWRSADIRALHEPVQFIPLYKHARGAQLIDVTPYTKLSVAPDAHSYTSHHGRYVLKDSAIWDGGLVKRGASAADSRSASSVNQFSLRNESVGVDDRSVSARLREASRVGSRSPSMASGGRNRASRGGTRDNPVVFEEQQLGAILSGRYADAFAMPLPATFYGTS